MDDASETKSICLVKSKGERVAFLMFLLKRIVLSVRVLVGRAGPRWVGHGA